MRIAICYAEALYQAAEENNIALEEIESQMKDFLITFEQSPLLEKILLSPMSSLQEKRKIIQSFSEKLQFSDFYENFLLLLVQKRRLRFLKNIYLSLQDIQRTRTGYTKARCWMTQALSDKNLQILKKHITEKTGKKTCLEIFIDPSLLGGIKITLENGITYDGTLRTQLQNLQNQFLAELQSMSS